MPLDDRGLVLLHVDTSANTPLPSIQVRDLVHDTDAAGNPTRVTGIKVRKSEADRLDEVEQDDANEDAAEGDGDTSKTLEFDAVVCALDLPGIKGVLPKSFRQMDFFDKIYKLDTVPIATVQVRFDGWVTEMNDDAAMMNTAGDLSDGRAAGIDNLLYSADAEFSCFADLAVVSPGEYYKEGEGSLIQAVFDERATKRSQEQLVQDCVSQLHKLFPSSRKLTCTWSKVTKLGQSLYREKPGQDKFRPTQATPIDNFFLAGSYTYQDYLDSMEGATRSGLMVADEIVARADAIKASSVAAAKAKAA